MVLIAVVIYVAVVLYLGHDHLTKTGQPMAGPEGLAVILAAIGGPAALYLILA